MRKLFLLCLIPILAAAQDIDPSIRGMVANLTGPDPQVRALSRQMLPRQGLEVVPAMIPLLDSEDDAVAGAAFDILMDLGNELSAPGRGKDRRTLTEMLMPLVAAERPEKERITGLRLLERLVPPGHKVDPIASMLSEKKMREKARTALERIDTEESRAALISALGSSDPGFQVAILDSLGEMRDPASLDDILRLTVTGPREVQVAALRALAWTGNPRYLKVARSVCASATGAAGNEAMDSLLELTEAIARKGGNWEVAIREFEGIAQAGARPQREAALAGLGRYGDERHVEFILEAIRGATESAFVTGIHALGQLAGEGATRSLVKQYAGLSTEVQLAVLPHLEGRGETASQVLMEAAKSSDPRFRMAALKALARSDSKGAMESLLQAAQQGTPEEKALALDGLWRVGESLGKKGKTHEAGLAFQGLWTESPELDMKRRALQGIAKHPSPGGQDMAMEAAGNPALRPESISALQAVAGALIATAQPEKAMQAYRKILELQPDAATLQSVVGVMKNLDSNLNLAQTLGFVTRWRVAGPFGLGEDKKGWDTPLVGEPQVNLEQTYSSGDKQVSWKVVEGSGDLGKVNLLAEIGNCESCLGYAWAEFEVAEEMEATLSIGVDDGAKAWLNEDLVLDHFRVGALVLDSEKAQIHLKKGRNTLLLKVFQNNMPWEYCVRFLTQQGVPIPCRQP
jgi:HEAT repeat protein